MRFMLPRSSRVACVAAALTFGPAGSVYGDGDSHDDIVAIGATSGATGTNPFGVFLDNGAAACTGDVDGSGEVDFGDLLAILGSWGPCE